MIDTIAPGPDDIVLPKTSSSVFISTNLDYLLRCLGKRQARAHNPPAPTPAGHMHQRLDLLTCCHLLTCAPLHQRTSGSQVGATVWLLKGGRSAYAQRRKQGVWQVVMAGALTDQCVESAVRDACDLQYLVTLVTGAPREMGLGFWWRGGVATCPALHVPRFFYPGQGVC